MLFKELAIPVLIALPKLLSPTLRMAEAPSDLTPLSELSDSSARITTKILDSTDLRFLSSFKTSGISHLKLASSSNAGITTVNELFSPTLLTLASLSTRGPLYSAFNPQTLSQLV